MPAETNCEDPAKPSTFNAILGVPEADLKKITKNDGNRGVLRSTIESRLTTIINQTERSHYPLDEKKLRNKLKCRKRFLNDVDDNIMKKIQQLEQLRYDKKLYVTMISTDNEVRALLNKKNSFNKRGDDIKKRTRRTKRKIMDDEYEQPAKKIKYDSQMVDFDIESDSDDY